MGTGGRMPASMVASWNPGQVKHFYDLPWHSQSYRDRLVVARRAFTELTKLKL